MNLYVHVPFCVSKCRYCAFHSETGTSAEALAAFPRLIAREGALRAPGARPTTLYLGGGTPSSLGPDGLRALAAALPALADGAEFTVELNPADVDAPLAEALRAAGVTRASLGAQTFDPAALRFLGRRHTVADTLAAASALRHAGFDNVSLDLIAAVPGCCGASFRRSLRARRRCASNPATFTRYMAAGGRRGTDRRPRRTFGPSREDALILSRRSTAGESETCCTGRAGRRAMKSPTSSAARFECRPQPLIAIVAETTYRPSPRGCLAPGARSARIHALSQRWASALEAGLSPAAGKSESHAVPGETICKRNGFVTRWFGLCPRAVRPDPATCGCAGGTSGGLLVEAPSQGASSCVSWRPPTRYPRSPRSPRHDAVSLESLVESPEPRELTHSRLPTSGAAYALTSRGAKWPTRSWRSFDQPWSVSATLSRWSLARRKAMTMSE